MILLDSESTVCTFYNEDFVEEIRPHENGKFLKVHTSSGTHISSLVANYPRLDMQVWYNKDSLAKILSLAAVRKLCRVTTNPREGSYMYTCQKQT